MIDEIFEVVSLISLLICLVEREVRVVLFRGLTTVEMKSDAGALSSS